MGGVHEAVTFGSFPISQDHLCDIRQTPCSLWPPFILEISTVPLSLISSLLLPHSLRLTAPIRPYVNHLMRLVFLDQPQFSNHSCAGSSNLRGPNWPVQKMTLPCLRSAAIF